MTGVQTREILLSEYEDNMLGNKSGYSKIFIKKETANSDAGYVLRYVFREILGWNAADFQNRATDQLFRDLKLSRIVSMITFPRYASSDKTYYLASLIYPETVRYSETTQILNIYKDVLSGRSSHFPSGFFDGESGIATLRICLRYAAGVFLPGVTGYEFYYYFAQKRQADRFFKNSCLTTPVKKYYDNPVAAMHGICDDSDDSEFWYHYVLFVTEWNKMDTGTKIDILPV